MLNNITLEKIVKTIIATLTIVTVGLIAYNFSNLIAYAIIAMLLSYMLDPVVNRMQAAGMNRTFAITVTLASVILIIIWVSTSVIPIIANQMAGLTRQLNVDTLIFVATQIETLIRENFEFIPEGYLRDNITMLAENFFNMGRFTDLLGNMIGIFTNLFAAFLVIPFATFFFLKDGYRIRRDILSLVPNKYFETALSLVDKIETRLGYYFRSVTIQCSLVGIVSWIALSLAGLNNAVSVGITIGVANSIPYFGPIIGYILSIVIAIIETGDFSLVIPCILAVFTAQVLDNLVFQPLIFSKSADIHPVAILFIILIGAQTAGILGMLVAIPIATIIKITIKQIIWSFNNYFVFRKSASQPTLLNTETSATGVRNQSE
ncbi:AI-2E family transporter [Rhodohalobacter mucosus]|uniref:AI-2E family transporter n=1 Tax=Rhodohalobacter mucosus TaxID=2079485 RepID=A0A316TSF0_9BACT|nr:AI-2E family transporter [Rhodohalobacter mucosus]PWN05164.1 AI-2E family transporter [Rhodohalobacter mucosus]